MNVISNEMHKYTVTGMQEKGKYLANFLPLVQRLTVEEVPELPSTEWRPIAGINVTTPSEIKGCACARLEKFPVYLSKDCKGISMYNVTQATKFATPALVLPALLHTAKGVLMSDLRCCTVAAEGVQRGRVFRDQPENFRVAATARNVQGHEGQRGGGADESISGSLGQATDKHKALWLCELKSMQEALASAGAPGSGTFGKNVGKKDGGKGGKTQRGQKRPGPWTRGPPYQGLAQPYHEARETEAAGSAQPAGDPQQENDWASRAEALWRCGRLHLIRAAPKQDFTWRVTIAPGVNVDTWEEDEMHKDYYAVVLTWCGDRLYHHEALRKAARGSRDVDLGALQMIYNIERRYDLESPRVNILRHRLPRPVVEEVAKKRRIVLSPDQQQAFEFLNKEEKPVMLIKALAGTGKSTIATIIVEALYENEAARDKNEAVVILGPSRQLRDEHTLDTHFITQADSSMAADLCVKVLWLGRESDQGLLPTWDQQMWAKVKTMLAEPIKNLKDRGCQGRGAGLLCVPELRTYNGGVLRSGWRG